MIALLILVGLFVMVVVLAKLFGAGTGSSNATGNSSGDSGYVPMVHGGHHHHHTPDCGHGDAGSGTSGGGDSGGGGDGGGGGSD